MSINVMLMSPFHREDALKEMKEYCEYYGCKWQFRKQMAFGGQIYGQGSCTGVPKVPKALCDRQATSKAV